MVVVVVVVVVVEEEEVHLAAQMWRNASFRLVQPAALFSFVPKKNFSRGGAACKGQHGQCLIGHCDGSCDFFRERCRVRRE
jgi:hypothetical protein